MVKDLGFVALSFLHLHSSLPNYMMQTLLMSVEDAVMYSPDLPSGMKGSFSWLFSGQLANSA